MMRDRPIPVAAFRRAWMRSDLAGNAVAKKFGLSHDGALRKARALGLPAKPVGRRSHLDPVTFAVLWAAGVHLEDMGRHFGLSASAMSRAATRLGLPRRGQGFQPLAHAADIPAILLAHAMARDAAAEQRQMILAEMADRVSAYRFVCAEKGRAA